MTSSTVSNQTASSEQVSFRTWIGVIAASLASFLGMVCVQIVLPSVEDLSGTLGVPLTLGSWALFSYLLSLIISIPVAASFSRIFSTRRYFIVNACLFIVCTIVCSQTSSFVVIIVCNSLRGFTAGGLSLIAISTINTELPPAKRPIGLTLSLLMGSLAPAIGPAIGGWLTYNYSWRYGFLVTLVPAVLILVGAAYGLRREPMRLSMLKRFDWLGAALFASFIISSQYVLQYAVYKNWFTYKPIVFFTFTGIVSLLLFVIVELGRRQYPLINLHLMKQVDFAKSIVVTLMFSFGQGESLIILLFFLIPVQHYDPLDLAKTVTAFGLPQLFVAPFLPMLMARFDPRLIVSVGLIGYAISYWMNVHLTGLTAMTEMIPSLILRGLMQNLISTPMATIVTSQVKKEDARVASTFFSVSVYIGVTSGVAFLKEFQNRRAQFHASRINEAVSLYSTATRQQVNELTQHFMSQGSPKNIANSQAMDVIHSTISRQGSIMAFSDIYYVTGWLLLITAGAVWLLKKPKASGNS